MIAFLLVVYLAGVLVMFGASMAWSNERVPGATWWGALGGSLFWPILVPIAIGMGFGEVMAERNRSRGGES